MTEAERNAEISWIRHSLVAMRDRHAQEMDALLTRLEMIEGESPPALQGENIDWEAFVADL